MSDERQFKRGDRVVLRSVPGIEVRRGTVLSSSHDCFGTLQYEVRIDLSGSTRHTREYVPEYQLEPAP